MQRRQLMRGAAAWGLLAAGPSWAQSHPAFLKLRMLIPANAGGGWDQTGRTLGAALQAAGQAGEVVYENKGGKGGVPGLAHFVEQYGQDPAALMVGGFVMLGSIALNRPAVDLSRVTPVARLTTELLVLVVPADSRYRSLAAFAADLKAKPASLPIAGGSAGGVDHMCAAMVARAVGVEAQALAYQPFASGAEVLAAVNSGKAAAAISGYGEMKEGLASGKLRALGISSRRASFGVPSMTEQGVKVELGNWRGVFAAGGISAPQVAALRDAVQRATQHAAWKEALQRNSWQAAWATDTDFRQALEFDQTVAQVMVHLLRLKS